MKVIITISDTEDGLINIGLDFDPALEIEGHVQTPAEQMAEAIMMAIHRMVKEQKEHNPGVEESVIAQNGKVINDPFSK